MRLYLKNKYGVSKAFLFIGMVPGNQKLYEILQSSGYVLIFKPTVRYIENGKETVKGNVDAELVLYAAAKVYNEYDKAVIISGDGDFACLYEYLVEHQKLLRIMTPNRRYSKLLRTFIKYIVNIDELRKRIAYTPSYSIKIKSARGRSKP
ncbi:NYN domain-containing protein [TM7 phylum sp. oral taxon 350]|nr:NYN domain-containing protein [TM7 phylum sp. oral taxon 350]